MRIDHVGGEAVRILATQVAAGRPGAKGELIPGIAKRAYEFEGKRGSSTSKRHLSTVQKYVDEAVAQGARVVPGGSRWSDIGPYCLAPTILTDVTSDMRIYREGVFGPVVSVFGYATVDDAAASANDSAFGLNACVYGRDIERAKQVGGRIRAGMVNIDESLAAYGSMGAPAGGAWRTLASAIGKDHTACSSTPRHKKLRCNVCHCRPQMTDCPREYSKGSG